MKPKIKTLKNGLRIVTVPMKGAQTVTVMTLVGTGLYHESRAENGISHFLEHMCFKGTTNRTNKEINWELDAIGSLTNAFTWKEMTAYYTTGQKKHWKQMLEITSDIYLHSTFPQEEIEKERGVILGEIDMYEDMPRSKVKDVLMELLYKDQPAGWQTLGPKENIKKFSQSDFRKYYEKHYAPNNTVIVVAGDVIAGEVNRQADRYFKNLKKKKTPKPKPINEDQKSAQIKIHYKKTDQAHLLLALRTAGLTHKDHRILSVLSGVLGQGASSRMFERLREDLGMGYYVGAEQESHTKNGFLMARAGVDPKHTEEAIKEVINLFEGLKERTISTKELKKTKEYIIGNLKRNLESSSDQVEWYGLQAIRGLELKTPEQVFKEIRAVTPEDIRCVARKIFVNDRLNCAIVGPYKDSKQFKKMLKFS